MTPPATQPCRSGDKTRIGFFIAAALVAALLAITARSFWIDECYTALIAQQPTLADWWRHLLAEHCSDIAQPFYVFWIWLCEKMVGSSELALRAVNVFWFAGGLLAVVWSFAGRRTLQMAVFLTAAASPFVWYYLNEARSYSMQLNASLMLFSLIHHWWDKPDTLVISARKQAWLFVAVWVLLCGSSMLSMILGLTPLLLVGVLLPWKNIFVLLRAGWPAWLTAFGLLSFLGVYYLWTKHLGQLATPATGADWRNALFIGYELLGFAGLGPGRLEIRADGFHAFKPYAIGLAVYGVLVAGIIVLALRKLWHRLGGRKLLAVMLATGLPALILLGLASGLHFRILGRHCAALAPAGFFLLGLGLAQAWRGGWPGRALAAGFLVFYLASAGSLRFAHRHEKDNYRAAAVIARQALADGKTVWWAACGDAAIYYHVPVVPPGSATPAIALLMMNPAPETVRTAAPPDMIILSRREVYDPLGLLAEFMELRHYRAMTNLVAFTVWQSEAGK
jgi:hypothetical protein